jgi:hypothetical protein
VIIRRMQPATRPPNGLEMSRPPARACGASLYGSMAGGASVELRHVGVGSIELLGAEGLYWEDSVSTAPRSAS